jgi:hypothetical protein
MIGHPQYAAKDFMPDAHGLQDVPEDEFKCIDLALHYINCGDSLEDLQRKRGSVLSYAA